MIDKFKKFLSAKNLDYEQIDDTLLGFKAEDLNMLFATDSNDKSYIRILVPQIDVASNLKPQDWEQIAILNYEYKAAKIVKVDDDLWIACEVFVYSSVLQDLVYNRMIIACKTIYSAYVKYRKEK